MKNNKGFTIVELIVSFSLVMIVMIYLLKTILVVGNKENELLTLQEYTVVEANLLKDIYTDIKKTNSSEVKIQDLNDGIYIEGVGKQIEFDKENNSIIYGDVIYELPEGVKLADKSYTVESISDSNIVSLNNTFNIGKINLNVNNKLKSIKIVHQFFDKSSAEKTLYKEIILNGTDPVLSDNLVPVTIDNDGTVKKADLYSNWYSYANKRWANAVILENPNQTYTEGQVIPEANIESYFVWIPKYKYKLFDLGNYNSYIEGKPTTASNAKTIDIVFGTTNTSDSNEGECTTPGTSGGTGNCAVNKYMTHPAFLAFNTNGLWVGKFETTGTIDNLSVKPGLASLRSQTAKSMFDAAYNYKTTNESHAMKNTEWGAVAYLSHSKYGINKEVNINNNSNRLTGYSAVVEPTCYTIASSDCNKFGTTSDITLPYNTSTGYKASTTGNITGIYDISGGVHEYIASYIEGKYGSSGYTSDPITNYTNGEKYFDKYKDASTWASFNNRILGDATGEMGPFYFYEDNDQHRNHNNWYTDSAHIIYSGAPWFFRGCTYTGGILAGQFHFANYSGQSDGAIGFRLVLTK